MRKLSFWNRHCVNVTSASMLTAVLLLSGCAANRESRTAVRSGSLQRSVTGEIIFGKAPTTLTSLALKPGLLRTIGGLPAGMGVTEQHEGLEVRVESDGEGGVNVTAVSHARPEITVRETSDLKLESEEATAEEKQPVPSFWERTRTKVLCCFVLLLLFWGLRRFKDKSRNN